MSKTSMNKEELARYLVRESNVLSHANSPQELAKRRQIQEQGKLREQAIANSRPLSVNDLTDISEFDHLLSNVSSRSLPNLVAQIWEKFTSNTKINEFKFIRCGVQFGEDAKTVENKSPKLTKFFGGRKNKSDTRKLQDTRPLDVRRFAYADPFQMPLIADTAVEDPARSRQNGKRELLNANAINFDGGRKFIAGQCPRDIELPGLWEMLAKNKVPLIVDLVAKEQYRNNELGGNQYSPGTGVNRGTNADISASHGVMCEQRGRLPLQDENGNPITYQPDPNNPELKVVEVVIEDLKIGEGDDAHHMQRIHFPIWADFGAVSPKALRALANTVEWLSPDPSRPTHMHCRAGVGRTGTLISFMAAKSQIQKAISRGNACNPKMIIKTLLGVIAKGRLDRGPAFVQGEKQFGLLVHALLEEFNAQLVSERSRTSNSSSRREVVLSRLNDNNPSQHVNIPPRLPARPKLNPTQSAQIEIGTSKEVRNHLQVVDQQRAGKSFDLERNSQPLIRDRQEQRRSLDAEFNRMALENESTLFDKSIQRSINVDEPAVRDESVDEKFSSVLKALPIKPESDANFAEEMTQYVAEKFEEEQISLPVSSVQIDSIEKENATLKLQNDALLKADAASQIKIAFLEDQVQTLKQQMENMNQRLRQVEMSTLDQISDDDFQEAQKKTSEESTRH